MLCATAHTWRSEGHPQKSVVIFSGLNLDHQGWLELPLSTEPSLQPLQEFLKPTFYIKNQLKMNK